MAGERKTERQKEVRSKNKQTKRKRKRKARTQERERLKGKRQRRREHTWRQSAETRVRRQGAGYRDRVRRQSAQTECGDRVRRQTAETECGCLTWHRDQNLKCSWRLQGSSTNNSTQLNREHASALRPHIIAKSNSECI